jgi:FkbM family methyltransferase
MLARRYIVLAMAAEQLDPIERAWSLVDGEVETSWDAPSRFGPPGIWARRLLMRVLRPYAIRRREVDRALLQAIRAAPARRATAAPAPDARANLAPRSALRHAVPLPEDAVEVETDLGSMLFDSRDRNLTPIVRQDRQWEADVAGFIGRRLVAGMTLVDVGAHVGYFSVLASRIVGESGQVFAVEVEPRNLEFLRANLWRQGCDNVTVLPLAAYDHRGHVRFVSNPDGLSGSSIDAEEGAAITMVPCARLDELLGDIPVDVIKIDVERSEPAVVRGAEALIRATQTLDIVTEFWPTHPSYGGSNPAEILDYYLSLGFQLRLLRHDGSTEPATPSEVLAGGEAGPIMYIVLRKG